MSEGEREEGSERGRERERERENFVEFVGCGVGAELNRALSRVGRQGCQG